jgi:hypothetical protein
VTAGPTAAAVTAAIAIPAVAVTTLPAPPQLHNEMPLVVVLTPKAGPGFRAKDLSSIEEMLLSALDGTKQLRLISHANDQTLLDVLAGSMSVDYVAATEVAKLDGGTVMTLRLIDVRHQQVVVHARQLAETNAGLGAAADDVAGQAVEAILGKVAAGHSARAENDLR